METRRREKKGNELKRKRAGDCNSKLRDDGILDVSTAAIQFSKEARNLTCWCRAVSEIKRKQILDCLRVLAPKFVGIVEATL